jgi:hypothetical protein
MMRSVVQSSQRAFLFLCFFSPTALAVFDPLYSRTSPNTKFGLKFLLVVSCLLPGLGVGARRSQLPVLSVSCVLLSSALILPVMLVIKV